MNSQEMLLENKNAVANIYKIFFEFLKNIADQKKFDLTAKEPSIEAKNGAEITNLSILRFQIGKNSCIYNLGYSQNNFLSIWNELFAAKTDPATTTVKPTEFELTKALFQSLNAELKSRGHSIDMKTAIIQDSADMGKWNKINVDQTLVFPIGTPKGDLILEIPLFDSKFATQMTLDFYGYKESARIMVVDDSPVSRKMSKHLLAMAGYFNVEETTDGQQAFTKIFGSRPAFDLVVADWHMPVMSGFELLKKLRAVEDFKKLPIILVTGEKNKDEVVSAIKEGVNAYLVKPVLPENFLKTLKKTSGQP